MLKSFIHSILHRSDYTRLVNGIYGKVQILVRKQFIAEP